MIAVQAVSRFPASARRCTMSWVQRYCTGDCEVVLESAYKARVSLRPKRCKRVNFSGEDGSKRLPNMLCSEALPSRRYFHVATNVSGAAPVNLLSALNSNPERYASS